MYLFIVLLLILKKKLYDLMNKYFGFGGSFSGVLKNLLTFFNLLAYPSIKLLCTFFMCLTHYEKNIMQSVSYQSGAILM